MAGDLTGGYMRKGLILLLSLVATAAHAAAPTRCVDPETGAVTFTDTGCPHGAGEGVTVHPENRVDVPAGVGPWTEFQAQQQSAPPPAAQVRQIGGMTAGRDACEEAARPHAGARGGQLTAAQREMVAGCAGEPAPSRSGQRSPAAMPVAAPVPSVITSCDESGCWDNMGGRYNKGAGSTYFHQSGKACQLIGGQMHCP